MAGQPVSRTLWQRIYALIEAGIDVMARYPFDLTELHWNYELFDPPPEDGGSAGGSSRPPSGPSSGPCRAIKVVPPPASRHYQAARPTRISARPARRKQPV